MSSTTSCDRRKKPTCDNSSVLWAAIVVAVAILVGALVLCLCVRHLDRAACVVNPLCTAVSKTESEPNSAVVTLSLPGGARITKIYASLIQNTKCPVNNGNIAILTPEQTPSFSHAFVIDPCAVGGSYETTLVQPLCVGAEGGNVVFSVARGLDLAKAEYLQVTAVYCPGDCE